MNKSDKEFLAGIKERVLSWDYLINSQENYDALVRLADSPQANASWLALSKKTSTQKCELGEQSIYSVAYAVGRAGVNVYLRFSQKRTSREIREASEAAVFYATELRRLILNNNTLRFPGPSLMPLAEQAATSRITRAISFMSSESARTNSGTDILPFAIERQLDELQVRDFPSHPNLTTSQATHILSWHGDEHFLRRLEEFTKLARESANFTPIVPRPNKEMANEHAFALCICFELDEAFGSPCYEVTAGFCSAVFRSVIEADTVKKWWHRRSDFWRDTS
jgi:hypothetical protein